MFAVWACLPWDLAPVFEQLNRHQVMLLRTVSSILIWQLRLGPFSHLRIRCWGSINEATDPEPLSASRRAVLTPEIVIRLGCQCHATISGVLLHGKLWTPSPYSISAASETEQISELLNKGSLETEEDYLVRNKESNGSCNWDRSSYD